MFPFFFFNIFSICVSRARNKKEKEKKKEKVIDKDRGKNVVKTELPFLVFLWLIVGGPLSIWGVNTIKITIASKNHN